jgi:hypothetical protein
MLAWTNLQTNEVNRYYVWWHKTNLKLEPANNVCPILCIVKINIVTYTEHTALPLEGPFGEFFIGQYSLLVIRVVWKT